MQEVIELDFDRIETLLFYYNNNDRENFREHFPEIKDLKQVTIFYVDEGRFQVNFIYEDPDRLANVFLLNKPTIH